MNCVERRVIKLIVGVAFMMMLILQIIFAAKTKNKDALYGWICALIGFMGNFIRCVL